jgi:hypothetical protein
MTEQPKPRTFGDVRKGLADAMVALHDGKITVKQSNGILRQAKKETAAMVKAAKAARVP